MQRGDKLTEELWWVKLDLKFVREWEHVTKVDSASSNSRNISNFFPWNCDLHTEVKCRQTEQFAWILNFPWNRASFWTKCPFGLLRDNVNLSVPLDLGLPWNGLELTSLLTLLKITWNGSLASLWILSSTEFFREFDGNDANVDSALTQAYYGSQSLDLIFWELVSQQWHCLKNYVKSLHKLHWTLLWDS